VGGGGGRKGNVNFSEKSAVWKEKEGKKTFLFSEKEGKLSKCIRTKDKGRRRIFERKREVCILTLKTGKGLSI